MTSSPLAVKAMNNLKDRSPRRYPRKSTIAELTANEPNIEVSILGLLNQIHSINGAVARACLSEDGYFSQDEDIDPAVSKTAERRLTERLENLAMAFEITLGGVKNWADRARNFEQNTVVKAKQTPAAKRKKITSSNIDVEEEAVHWVTKLLKEGGAIDANYLRVFDHFINETSRPLRPMFDLIALIESIADTANGRPCSIAAERAAKANPQASPERSEHAESDEENESDEGNDSASHSPEHDSDSDQDMPDAAASPPATEDVPSPNLLPTPPLTSKATTFPQSEPPPSPPQPQVNRTLSPSTPHPAPTESQPTPYYIARLTSRGYLPSPFSTLSLTDGPIWTRILAAARVALFAANHLASQTESAKDQAHRQKNVWRKMTNYFDERAGLIQRFRAEGGLPDSKERPHVPLSAEEREEHEAADAVRQVEEMIQRESSGGGDAGAEGNDEAEEMRARYRQGMQRFEREERWRRSPSIKWTDREEDIAGKRLTSIDENRGRAPTRRLDEKDKGNDKRLPGARSPAPLGFGVRASIETNTDFSRLGFKSAFDRDVDMTGRGEENPFLTTRSPFDVKGKGKMTPRDWDQRPGKGMMDPLDDIYAAGSDEEEDE